MQIDEKPEEVANVEESKDTPMETTNELVKEKPFEVPEWLKCKRADLGLVMRCSRVR